MDIIDFPTFIGFVLTAGAIVLSPGPDTLLILKNALISGRRAGLATVFGVQIGLAAHTLLAIAGISLVISQNPILFKGVALAGALYLAWLGWQSFRGAGPGRLTTDGPAITNKRAIRDAVVCNLLNPKVIVLFLALFPNFVDYNRGDVTLQVTVLALILVAINVIWQAPMALAADRLRQWFANERRTRMVAHATGLILMFFAGLLVVDHLI